MLKSCWIDGCKLRLWLVTPSGTVSIETTCDFVALFNTEINGQ